MNKKPVGRPKKKASEKKVTLTVSVAKKHVTEFVPKLQELAKPYKD
jgi:hypothetical protein